MKKGKELFIWTSSGVIIGFLFFVFVLGPAESPNETSALNERAMYQAVVCPTIIRANGDVEEIECGHNVFTQEGMNATRNTLGVGSDTGVAFTYIGLECANKDAGLFNITLSDECDETGLTRASGTYIMNGVTVMMPGNWSIYNTFTLTGTAVTVYGAGLFNATSSANNDTMLAIANFSTAASLEANDQLTVNWTIKVS